MPQLRLLARLQLRDDRHRQLLAQLDSPLVEGVDSPDRALGEDAVLVEGDQGAQRLGGQPVGEDRVGGAVALEDSVRDQRLRRALLAHLLGRLAEGERLALGEDVGHQQVVVVAERVVGVGMKPMKSQGISSRALVDQLVEGVLAVGPRLAPVDGAGVVVDAGAVEGDVLSVGLHRQLLKVGGEAVQVLVVGEDAAGLGAEEVAVPDGQQAHQHRQVRGHRRARGSARPSRGSRPASRRSGPGRSPASSRGRSPSPSSSGPPPTPRSRTCCRCRCRTSATASALVETATKCLATAASSPPSPASAHSRARARVGHRLQGGEGLRGDRRTASPAGSRSRVDSTKSVPSTLETKRKVISRRL